MRVRSRLGAVVVCAAVLFARTARAGCPNTCDVTIEPASIAPPLDCLLVEVTPETCDCGAFVKMTNGCAAPVDTVGWTLASCGQPGEGAGSLTMNCSTLSPKAVGNSPLRTSGTGHKEWPLQIAAQGTSYTVTVAANVTAFHQGGGCAMSPTRPASAPFSGALGLVIAFSWSKRRRGPRSSRAVLKRC
jgi:hypothetical protein